MKMKTLSLSLPALIISFGSWAHGYIESPASRAYQCKLGQNTDCGAVQWEPQSIEKDSGFPAGPLPPDGELASGGIANFHPIDKQSPNIWVKNNIQPGKNTFTWHITAPHKTTNWRYYITRQNWDQNKPLDREAFEAAPFCQVDDHGAKPGNRVKHECDVPARTGYQVIYGVWEINDTKNSFYQAIDVQFDQETVSSEWSKQLAGQVTGKDLQLGDRVIAQFFAADSEVEAERTTLTIDTPEQRASKQWSFDLATKINRQYQDIRSGVKVSDGTINPVSGINNVYVHSDSRLEKVLISYKESSPQASEQVTVCEVHVSPIHQGNATLEFTAAVKGEVSFDAKVLNQDGDEKAALKQDIANSEQRLKLFLEQVAPGHHSLKYTATNTAGKLVRQEVIDLQLENEGSGSTGDYDFVFPENLPSYVAGSVVLQPKDSKTYQCKPFPYSGYCIQWSPQATQFEPGIGSNWQDAWTLKTQ